MTQLFRILIFTIVIIGCSSQTTYNEGSENNIPAAFQENNSNISLKDYKRGGNNIIEELWADYLKDNEQVVKELDKLDALKSDIREDRETFDKFISKNDAYYRSANAVKVGITDSLLKEKMSLSMQKSEDNYMKKISGYKDRRASISELYSKINNLVAVLKIEETRKMTEEYQKNTKFLLEELDKDIKELEKIKDYFEGSL